MKKAKILLSAIALITLVSGALAFKASRFETHPFFTYGASTTKVGGPIVTGCVVPRAFFKITDPAGIAVPYTDITVITNISTYCHTFVIDADVE